MCSLCVHVRMHVCAHMYSHLHMCVQVSMEKMLDSLNIEFDK